MYFDARELDNNSLIEGDICIIGAGAAGISIALDWINTNYKVILLEGGGFEYDKKIQNLYKGKINGPKCLPLMSSRSHLFGGTTNIWGGHCSPFDEMDFEKRNWVDNSGWPIKKKDLNPYYEKATKILELQTDDYSINYWLKNNPSYTKLQINNDIITEKIWQYSPPTRFNDKYKDVIIDAKNIYLYTYANVTNISANENISSIKEVTLKNHTGKTHKVKAKYFILACGAIQNARLLLNSKKQINNGIGNENDNVGRYFMEHVHVNAAELWLNNTFPMSFYLLNWGITKGRAELAITANEQQKHRILNGTAKIDFLKNDRSRKSFFDMYSNEDPKKNGYIMSYSEKINKKIQLFKASRVENIDRAYGLNVKIEQVPNPDSRVFLDNEKDVLDMQKANLRWEITSFEKRSIKKMVELIGREVGVSDIGRIKLMESLHDGNNQNWIENRYPGCHHMGTTRMSNNPKNGVVDLNCKIHSLNNLFVAGSSCFTTSGSANPTLTLIALSLRLSNYVKSKIE